MLIWTFQVTDQLSISWSDSQVIGFLFYGQVILLSHSSVEFPVNPLLLFDIANTTS